MASGLLWGSFWIREAVAILPPYPPCHIPKPHVARWSQVATSLPTQQVGTRPHGWFGARLYLLRVAESGPGHAHFHLCSAARKTKPNSLPPHSWIGAGLPPTLPLRSQMEPYHTYSRHCIQATSQTWPADGLGTTHLVYQAKMLSTTSGDEQSHLWVSLSSECKSNFH